MDLCRFKRTVALCRERGARPAPVHPLSGTGSYLVLQALNSLLAENCSGQVPGSRRPSRASALGNVKTEPCVATDLGTLNEASSWGSWFLHYSKYLTALDTVS